MSKILGDAKNIRSLLWGAKFAIDYYQREYRWETKQVAELIEDLAGKFLEDYDPGHARNNVKHYGHYFLGSIIISDKEGQKFIIDGQQRMTSVTLLLIFLHRQLEDDLDKAQLKSLIFSQKYGSLSFNLEVPERRRCMNALLNGEPFDEDGQSESVVNILARFQDIEAQFPDGLTGKVLPYFADWLIENVHFVEITAYSDSDAYTIFESMNDRGLSLAPAEMLKGYLLANITAPEFRNDASQTWQDRVADLKKLGKEEDAAAIKAWLRSQHAKTIRERKRGAQPRDFDQVGTEFHRWVRDHAKNLGLAGSADFTRLIQEDFAFYVQWYERIRRAAETLTEGLEPIRFNARNNFTLQYPMLLAPLRRGESNADIRRKLRIVSTYLDILIARRIWNWKDTSYSTMQYGMFQLILKIRGKSTSKLAAVLTKNLAGEEVTFANNARFRLHGMNGRQIHHLLVRMTDYVETQSDRRTSRYDEYIQRRGKNGYEVEHIWADHYERHKDEFEHPNDFAEYRNRIGGLLLLPKSFNASYGDLSYEEKREHYNSQNLLARSLHERAYDHNPGFLRFQVKSGLPFKPHATYKKRDLDARQELYRQIAEQIWNPDLLRQEVER